MSGPTSAATRAAIPNAARVVSPVFWGETGIFTSNRMSQKFFKKELAQRNSFDILTAPLARKAGRTACLQTDN
jgi:hypothetical protein